MKWLLVAMIILYHGDATLPLEKPDIQWKPCSCPGDATLGLNEQDFMLMQMYVQGLEYQCHR